MPIDRPVPNIESILPYLDAYRKIIHIPAELALVERMPARGTTLAAACELGLGIDRAGLPDTEAAYIYSHANSLIHRDLVSLYFVKSFTSTERVTPVLTEGGHQFYTWPDILKEIKFDFDTNFPLKSTFARASYRGQTLVARPLVMRRMVLGGYIKSTVRINHYLSDSVFPPSYFRKSQQPIAGEIFWQYIGNSDRIVCLHNEVPVPPRPTSYTSATTDGLIGTGGVEGPGQVFPATNYTGWDEFTLQSSQQFVEGLWHLTEVVIEPPEEKEPVWIYQ